MDVSGLSVACSWPFASRSLMCLQSDREHARVDRDMFADSVLAEFDCTALASGLEDFEQADGNLAKPEELHRIANTEGEDASEVGTYWQREQRRAKSGSRTAGSRALSSKSSPGPPEGDLGPASGETSPAICVSSLVIIDENTVSTAESAAILARDACISASIFPFFPVR